MAADVDIYNQGLIAIGVPPILSFAGKAKANTIGKFLFPIIRDQETAKFLWNFAIERFLAAASTEVPVYGYSFKVPFPPDLLRLLEVESQRLVPSIRSVGNLDYGAYKVEGRNILVNESPVNLKYIRRVTDSTQFSVMFEEVLAARFAAELSIPLRNDREMMNVMKDMYQGIAATARFSDATEDAPVRLDSDDLLLSRGDYNISQIPRRL